MYFFTKFCRVCVQTDVELTNLETMDFDCIKLSDKLETCASLDVTQNNISSHICKSCTNKLRVSYHFQEMCKKSTEIIECYLSKLMEYSNDTDETFENWDLEVSVTPLPRLGIVKMAEPIEKSLPAAQNTSQICIEDIRSQSQQLSKASQSISKEYPVCVKKFQNEQKIDQQEQYLQITEKLLQDGLIVDRKSDSEELEHTPQSFSQGCPIKIKNEPLIDEPDKFSQTTQNIAQECRIRVKKFENEPIVDQPNQPSTQSVLSEIEKVVKDVPTTFKKQQKARITKKKLLTPSPNEKQKKERDKNLTKTNAKEGIGLENIINFTNNYKFADKNSCIHLDRNSNVELSNIDKLEHFSRNYFRRKSFTEFNNTVVSIIEHKDDFYDSSFDDSDLEEEFDDESEEEDMTEEVLVEPDIRIKNEVMGCEEEDTQSTFDYIVDTTFDDELGLKIEDPIIDPKESLEDMNNQPNTKPNETIKIRVKDEFNDVPDDDVEVRVKPEYVEMSEISEMQPYNNMVGESNPGPSFSSEFETYLNKYTSDSVNMLDKLVTNYPMAKKMFSPLNVRCRTRGQPYISPHLMDQFKFQCFRCEKCNRNFKSQGYLKAHTSKVH